MTDDEARQEEKDPVTLVGEVKEGETNDDLGTQECGELCSETEKENQTTLSSDADDCEKDRGNAPCDADEGCDLPAGVLGVSDHSGEDPDSDPAQDAGAKLVQLREELTDLEEKIAEQKAAYQRLERECAEFRELYPETPLSSLPDSVWADVQAGVALLPPRLGPYDYYAIACGYGAQPNLEPGPYCYFAPFITAAISPDPSAQPESLGNDLLRSSRAGVDNCRALLALDGLTPERQALLQKYYYRYISLALSNIGGVTEGVPVTRKVRRQTLSFIMEALAHVPDQLSDPSQEQIILNELVGNFLPDRLLKTAGKKELDNYYRHLRRLQKKYSQLTLVI